MARLALVALGGGAIAWGTSVLPRFWSETRLVRVATQIRAGIPFKEEVLEGLNGAVDAAERASYCRPPAAQAAAIVRLRLLEDAIAAGDRAQIDDGMGTVRRSIDQFLACTPADPFLWMVLYWLDVAQNGFKPEHLEFLRLSYRLGPNEGWIALKRNRLALAVYEQLPPDIAELATQEFAGLVDSGLVSETAESFLHSGARLRERLLSQLDRVTLFRREQFAKMLYRRGYDVAVPGVSPIDPRPWH